MKRPLSPRQCQARGMRLRLTYTLNGKYLLSRQYISQRDPDQDHQTKDSEKETVVAEDTPEPPFKITGLLASVLCTSLGSPH